MTNNIGFWRSWWEDVSVWHWAVGLSWIGVIATGNGEAIGSIIGGLFWVTIIYVIVYYWNRKKG